MSLRSDLEALLGPDRVWEGPVQDLWPVGLLRRRAGGPPAPVLRVRPSDYGQVSALLAWASANRTAVVPAAGLSGVCGAVSPAPGEVVLDLTGFDQILEIDEANLICRVQAGVVGADLEAELNRRGLTLGHFPSSLPVATVGGLISTRSSGQASGFYGNIEDLLLGVVVVLAGGTLLQSRPAPRSAVGPALHQLFIGAEGGLGVVLEATLRLSRIPPAVLGRGYRFDDLDSGLEAMRSILQAGLRPYVMRLYDPEDTRFQGSGADGGCLMVVATAGPAPVAEASAAVAAELCSAATDLGPGPWLHWLEHRYSLSAGRLRELMSAPGMMADTIELGADWTRVAALHAEVKAVLAADGRLSLCHFSHGTAQGCCAYFTVAGGCASDAEAEAAYHRIWEEVMAVALRHRATVSHHHGTGRQRAPWVRAEMGDWFRLWEGIGSALDPAAVMNPAAVGGRDR